MCGPHSQSCLENICAAKNVESNQVTYDECSWITTIADDVSIIKNFIMNHSMRLAIFNDFVPLKLLSVASSRFASVMVMLTRFKLLKASLQTMVISPRWNSYREDDTGKAKFVKEKVLDDIWWGSIDYILSFTSPMYDMLRICDTDKPCLHLVYDMWDTMIEKVKVAIYRHEGKRHEDSSTFYEVVHIILVDWWNKNSTPLHCLAHSLNPRYYSDEWLNEGPSRVLPHKDVDVAREKMKCMKKYFPNSVDRSKVNLEFPNFSSKAGEFADSDSIHDRYAMDPKSWWVTYGASAPLLQSVASKSLYNGGEIFQGDSGFCVAKMKDLPGSTFRDISAYMKKAEVKETEAFCKRGDRGDIVNAPPTSLAKPTAKHRQVMYELNVTPFSPPFLGLVHVQEAQFEILVSST
ncbi:hypothetical protein RHGRI_020997 [Rhododendron griersonianum]|uniref:Uncharacterized protein n=1 Tax=Rhododendron griersonianum TaxID=479676 RepID=A0AAV6JN23_9ERIC|nr:hypothetical protein RHGRI_020997 [Rhododendron griersonianum]